MIYCNHMQYMSNLNVCVTLITTNYNNKNALLDLRSYIHDQKKIYMFLDTHFSLFLKSKNSHFFLFKLCFHHLISNK